MEIVEFQGGKYHLLADGMGGFKLSPVEYRAKPCSLAQIAAEFKAEREEKAESKILGRIAHKGQEWDIVADSLGLKLVLVEEEWEVVAEIVLSEAYPCVLGTGKEPNWSKAPADATHYSKGMGWFLKADPEAHDCWLYWHKKPHHLAKGRWVSDGTHPSHDLIERPEQTGATMQKPTDATHYCPINDAFVKITGRTCHYYRDGQWVIENPARFSALLSLTEQELSEIREGGKKSPEQMGAKAEKNPTASQINDQAMKHIRDRASTYDQPQGERSMGKTVRAFNAITGRDLTESEGWLFMQVVKDVRQWQNPNEYHQDSGEDCIAYAALKAESLAGGR